MNKRVKKWSSFHQVSGQCTNFFRYCNTPAYLSLKAHKLNPKSLLKADIKDILGRLLQPTGNISTIRINTFFEIILKPISENFCKNGQTSCRDSHQYIEDLLNWKDYSPATEGKDPRRGRP